jgi:hypothetical protein
MYHVSACIAHEYGTTKCRVVILTGKLVNLNKSRNSKVFRENDGI